MEQVGVTLYCLNNDGFSYQEWSVYTELEKLITGSGKFGGKISYKAVTCKEKNVGKANYISARDQAIKEAVARIKKQHDKNYRETMEEAALVKNSDVTPMRAHNFNKYAEKLVLPAHISPKLNGRRLERKNGKYYAKSGLEDQVQDLELKDQIETLPYPWLDGEVYKHGMPLQFINSAWVKPNENTKDLEYHIYDIPVPALPWVTRYEALVNLQGVIEGLGLTRVKVVLCDTVTNLQEVDSVYESYLKGGYEGGVYRNLNSHYEHGKKSYGLIKRKPRQSAEAKVISVTEDRNGNGKMEVQGVLEGSPIFKCMLKTDVDYKDPRNGVTYKMTQLRDFVTIQEYVGKFITFEYEELSEKGVPTKPVGIMLRECDEDGVPLV